MELTPETAYSSKDCDAFFLLGYWHTFTIYNKKKLYYFKDEFTVLAPCSDEEKRISIFRDRIGKLLSDAGVPFNPRSDYLQALTRRWRQVQTFFSFQKDLNYCVLGNTLYIPRFSWFVNFMDFVAVFRIRNRVRRISMFLGLLDPQILVAK
jgi:hypothetical protein